jgi:hypothetical protein
VVVAIIMKVNTMWDTTVDTAAQLRSAMQIQTAIKNDRTGRVTKAESRHVYA